MFGRRSHLRFSISPAGEGGLRLLQDVLLHPSDGDLLVAVGRRAGIAGDLVSIELVDVDLSPRLEMRIVESRPIILDGAVRHRIQLALAGATDRGELAGRFLQRANVSAESHFAVLARDVGVRVFNCSSSGCLFEARVPLEVGTVGTLRLGWQGEEFVEEVRVSRSQRIQGAGSMYHIGAEFLWIDPPGNRSLRRAMRGAGQTVSIPPLRFPLSV
jgi:hypothetical protein